MQGEGEGRREGECAGTWLAAPAGPVRGCGDDQRAAVRSRHVFVATGAAAELFTTC